jgi:hypothetical protein
MKDEGKINPNFKIQILQNKSKIQNPNEPYAPLADLDFVI